MELESAAGVGVGLGITLAAVGAAFLTLMAGDGPAWAYAVLRKPGLAQLLWIIPLALYFRKRRPFTRGLWAAALIVAAFNSLVWLKLIRL